MEKPVDKAWRQRMVLIVIGVSGAGKTTVGQALGERLNWTFEDADDWHSAANVEKMRSGHALTDEDRAPWLQSLNVAIRKWIGEGADVVLACSALKESYRQALRAHVENGPSLQFVYLKGSYELISERLRQRKGSGHFMPESLLRSQFDTLEEPAVSEAYMVSVDQPLETIVQEIIGGMELNRRHC